MAVNLAVDLGNANTALQMPPKSNLQPNVPQGQETDFKTLMDNAQTKQNDARKTDFADRGTDKSQSVNEKNTRQDDKGISADQKPADNKTEQVKERPEGMEEVSDEALSEDMEKAAEEVFAALLNLLQSLGVEEVQVAPVMDELGLTQVDLLDQGNLMDVLTELLPPVNNAGEELIPADLADQLLQDAETLLKWQSTEEQLPVMETKDGTDAVVTDTNTIPMEEIVPEDAAAPEERRIDTQAVVQEGPVREEALKEQPKENTEDVTKPQTTAESMDAPKAETPVPSNQVENEGAKQQGREAGKQEDGNRGELNPFAERMNETEARFEVPEAPAPAMAANIDTEELMEQMNGFIRTQVRANMSQVELQLHPASLGTVNIQIVAKETGITAQFTTQNESVRAALESQIAELKEQLTNAGVKIEAVEVTVETHAFEQSMQREREQNNEQEEPAKKRGIRRLSAEQLNSLLEDGEEELSEEDQLAAEMMRANGNSLDYLA